MTIVNLAQDYIGSNNMNLLLPNGQYGTRDVGGKDHASARYIFTEPAPIARAVFHPSDDPLLTGQKEDGQDIEPEFYMPVLPLVLVNGAEGIGTGMDILLLGVLMLIWHCQGGVPTFHLITQSILCRISDV